MKREKIPEAALKEKSRETGIPFSDLLWGFLLEEFLRRIYSSAFKDVLWLAGEEMLGVANYAKSNKSALEFYYLESARPIAPDKLLPGQKLSKELLAYLEELIFPPEESGTLSWQVACAESDADFVWQITGNWDTGGKLSYYMEIPIAVRFHLLGEKPGYPKREELLPLLEGYAPVELVVYAPENQLGRHFYEIMKKLELISDMEAYDVVNEILKTESVSGRLIMEELEKLSAKEPSVLREKRMEQLAGYRDYTYMRKRWEKYEKAHGKTPEPWSEVIDRFTTFAAPIWQALCRHEIFFDDWMPELGRYLS
jgi:hypothetical protein